LCSSVSEARFVVIETFGVDMPSIDDVAMFRGTRQPCSTVAHPASDSDLRAGRRYVDAISGLRLLCIRPGRGSLTYQGRPLIPEHGSGVRLALAATSA
jgi:hypothetical protein